MIRNPLALLLTAVLLLGTAPGLACSTPTARPAQAAAPSAPDENGAVVEAAARRITVASPANGITTLGWYIAQQEGYFREVGIDARTVVQSGNTSAQSLAAQEVDFGMAVGALLAAYIHGAPLRTLLVQMDKPLYFLIAPPSISTVNDLIGQPIGVGSAGDTTQRALAISLRGIGIDPTAVIYMANVTGSQLMPSLQSGLVSAATVGPSVDLVSDRLGYHQIAFLGDYYEYLTAGLAAHEETLQEDPALVAGVVRAQLKAHRFMQRDRAGTVAHIEHFLSLSLELAEKAYDSYLRYLTADGTSEPLILQRILRNQRYALQAAGIPARSAMVDEAFRLDFARQANEQLDREGWYPRP